MCGHFGSVLFICKVLDWLMCGQYSCVLLICKKVFDWLMCGLFSSVTLLICKKVFDWLMCGHFSGALLICKMVCPVFECHYIGLNILSFGESEVMIIDYFVVDLDCA